MIMYYITNIVSLVYKYDLIQCLQTYLCVFEERRLYLYQRLGILLDNTSLLRSYPDTSMVTPSREQRRAGCYAPIVDPRIDIICVER